MKFVLTLIVLLLGSQLLLAQKPGKLDEQITTFAKENNLYNKRLKKLESIRTNSKLSEEERTQKLEKAFAKWDKNGITDTLCMEHMVQNFRYTELQCSYGNHKIYYPPLGQTLDYLLALTDLFIENGAISEANESIIKNILIHQVHNEKELESDVKWLSKEYYKYFLNARVNNDQVKMIVEYFADSTMDVESAVAKIQVLKKDDFEAFEAFLNQNQISYDDLLLSVYEKENRFNRSLSFNTNTLPRFQMGYNWTTMASNFNHRMYGIENLSNSKPIEFIQFAPLLENDNIRNVALFKLICDTWYEFELHKFEHSLTYQYVTKNGIIEDPTYELIDLKYSFKSGKFGNLFGVSDKSELEQLLISAYNDVYFSLRFHQEESIPVESIDVRLFELNDQQRAVVEALLDTNRHSSQVGLKKALAGASWNSFYTERSFQLACYLVFDQKANGVQRDWNHSTFYTNPFDLDSANASIEIPFLDSSRLSNLKLEMVNLLENEHYEINTYCFSRLDGIRTTATHGIRTNEKTNFVNFLEPLLGTLPSKYTRIAVKTKQKIDVPPQPKHTDRNPFADTRGYGSSYERDVAMPPPIPPQPRVVIEAKGEIIDFPDVEASFPEGPKAMKNWIENNLQYPEISKELGDQGRVYVKFVVETDGSITNVQVMRGGVSPELNREAKRIVRSMPKWTPGEVKGRQVRTQCRLPINFALD